MGPEKKILGELFHWLNDDKDIEFSDFRDNCTVRTAAEQDASQVQGVRAQGQGVGAEGEGGEGGHGAGPQAEVREQGVNPNSWLWSSL